MLEKVDYNIQLQQSIEDAIKFTIQTKARVKRRKGKNKKNKNVKYVQNKEAKELDGILDELLQMKEGERKAQLVRPIVSIREWLSNEYYCGAEVFNLYPFWKEHLIRIYESPVLINEIILTRRFRYR